MKRALELLKLIPAQTVQLSILDRLLTWKIPFNSGLGLKIQKLSDQECVIEAQSRRRQKNHVNGAHACFLALMAEYPAGLLLAQHFDFNDYRLIISELKMSYHKQGRGTLVARSLLGQDVPDKIDEEHFVKMQTEIKNSNGDLIAKGETLWQIKPWSKVRSSK